MSGLGDGMLPEQSGQRADAAPGARGVWPAGASDALRDTSSRVKDDHLERCGASGIRGGICGHQFRGQRYEVALDILVPALDPAAVEEIIALEQQAWSANGVTVTRGAVEKRIYGIEGKVRPNIVIAARVDDELEGAIFVSRVYEDNFPRTYELIPDRHSAGGGCLIDYSVITNPQHRIGLFEPLVRSTLCLAGGLGLESVIAFSRAEFLYYHMACNPRFAEQQLPPGRTGVPLPDVDGIVAEFLGGHPLTLHTTVRDYFGFAPSNTELPHLWERVCALRGVGDPRQRPAMPPAEDLRRYFALDALIDHGDPRALPRFGRFHVEQVGDRFLESHHQRLGAEFAGVLTVSRGDLRSLFMNVLMRYPVRFGRTPAHLADFGALG